MYLVTFIFGIILVKIQNFLLFFGGIPYEFSSLYTVVHTRIRDSAETYLKKSWKKACDVGKHRWLKPNTLTNATVVYRLGHLPSIWLTWVWFLVQSKFIYGSLYLFGAFLLQMNF